MPSTRFVDPRHGTHAPTTGVVGRRPGSIRRTSTTDAIHPEGPGGPLVLEGRARDLLTPAKGDPRVLGEARVRVRIIFNQGPAVAAIESTPEVEGLQALVGRVPSTGFRAVIDSDTAGRHGSLVYLLLDEIPASTLVAGYAVGHAASRGQVDQPRLSTRKPPGPALQIPDLCAGWQVGGVIMTHMGEHGSAPLVTGPEAPSVEDPEDGWAWHQAPPPGADGMRRRRRVDVVRGDDGLIDVDAFFRDSHHAPDGLETVVHEYTVTATVEPNQMRVADCQATPTVLPWLECPQAAASASRLAGMPVVNLRRQVRAELVGPTTCTHLNDTLRGLEDVAELVALADAALAETDR